MLRMSLEPDAAEHDLPLRKGRAIDWIEEALRPLTACSNQSALEEATARRQRASKRSDSDES
jgi:hypothetical protein